MGAGTTTCKLRGDSRNLRVRFSIRLPSDHPCPLTAAPPSVREVEQTSQGGECHLIVKSDERKDADGVQYFKGPIEETCLCNTFTTHETVATITGKTDRRVIVEAYPSDRLTLMDIIQDLTSIGDVEIESLSLVTDDDLNEHGTVNVAQLTELERETVELAIDKGYYRSSKGITLEELAINFDVSESRVSQRLAAAERKIVLDAME